MNPERDQTSQPTASTPGPAAPAELAGNGPAAAVEPAGPGAAPAGPSAGKAASNAGRTGCLIATLAGFVGLVLLLVAVVVVAVPFGAMTAKLTFDLGARATHVTVESRGDRPAFVITLAPGLEAEATAIACTVVKPDLHGTVLEAASFSILSSDGRRLAGDDTPCGG